MVTAHFEQLAAQVEQLSIQDKLRLMERLSVTLRRELEMPSPTELPDEWHAALRATYGILADDPIERPPQLPMEEREPLE